MALPFLLSLGLPALGAATGMAASPLLLSGIGAGLGSFLQTGDVGKGIQTGLIAGLGGKLMSSATSALGSAGAQATAQTAAGAAAPAATGSGLLNAALGPDLLAKKLGETTVAGALGAAGSGFGTGLIADAMNPQTIELPGKEKTDIPPPMPRIRSYQPKKDMDSTAEEEMITYYNPVKRMRGGGIMSMSSSHPIFQSFGDNMAGFLTQAQVESNKEKVQPFVQEVETLAKNTFGQEAFQQAPNQIQDIYQMHSGHLKESAQPLFPLQGSQEQLLAARNAGNRTAQVQFAPPPSLSRSKGEIGNIGIAQGVQNYDTTNRVTNAKSPFGRINRGFGASPLLRFGALGFAEGGIVPEEMNEKELIEEAVAAIKGESDNPKEILGLFLLKFGEEQLRNLVESVQSGELDETRERFAKGDKGMVNGPSDGSGKDDMVPATMDGDQDVLLTAGEFVIKKDSTDAIEKAFGGGFLDEVNDAGKDAPKKLKEKVAVA
jgi:hypothetical protein